MAKSCNQKGKILYLQKMLSETTSQKPVTMQEILAKLEEQGIRAERKSIYDDMETLRDFGMDIHYRRGREGGYYEEKSASDKTEADNTIIHQPAKQERNLKMCRNRLEKNLKHLQRSVLRHPPKQERI